MVVAKMDKKVCKFNKKVRKFDKQIRIFAKKVQICEESMKKNVRKKDPNSTNSTGVLPLLLYHPCAQTSGVIIYSDGRTNRKMNSKSKIEIE